MPSIEQLAAGYLRRVRVARDKMDELRRIVDEINGLPLSRADKLRIVDVMAARLPGARPLGFPTPQGGGDNIRYLELVRAVKTLIR